jgi:hypothetical protein
MTHGAIDRRTLIPLLAAGATTAMLARRAWAQQFPIPKTAADVPGPAPGTAMTKAYVQSVGRAACVWGWALGHRLINRIQIRAATSLTTAR